ncbi:MAG: class I SAM-dependent methyltransferase [Thermodesulfobacteriota bacterium]
MLFLSKAEKAQWEDLAKEIEAKNAAPDHYGEVLKPGIRSAFRCFAGVRLALSGKPETAREWFNAGVWEEGDAQFFNAFLTGFLARYGGRMAMPEKVFADPRPYLHFTHVPVLRNSRRNFMLCCIESLPRFSKPFRFLDLGCGDGSLTAMFLDTMRAAEKFDEFGEVVLVDSSAGMLEVAKKTLSGVVPEEKIKTVCAKFTDFMNDPGGPYDLALSSLAVHHMTAEVKREFFLRLAPRFNHFLLFELDANHDTPELGSPDLMISMYQAYGGLIEHVFAYDAPVDVALACVDRFLMNEAISLFTQPRGERNDYHMMRSQWRELLLESLGPDFSCLQNTACFEDLNFGLFMQHFGR